MVRSVPNSGALGYAILKFMPDTSTIYYKLVVSNIYNAVAAHIHAGAPSGFLLAVSLTLTVMPPATFTAT